MKERIVWLDNAKGLGILFVVLGHIYLGNSVQARFLYAFHVPLFFFLAGYLFEEGRSGGAGAFFLRMARTRVLPYLVFFVISFPLYVAGVGRATGLGWQAVLSADGYRPMVLQPLIALFVANGAQLGKVGNVALWFLPCLIVTECIFYAIVRSGRAALAAVVPALALAGFLEGAYLKWDVPWSADTALTATVFFAGGYLARALRQKGADGMPFSRPAKAGLAAAAFTVTGALAALNGRVDMSTTLYGNYLVFLAAACSGICAVAAVSQLLPATRPLSWLGRNSLALFGLHVPFIPVAKSALDALAEQVTRKDIVLQDDLYVALLAATTLALTSAAAYVITRFLPFLLGKGRQRGSQAFAG